MLRPFVENKAALHSAEVLLKESLQNSSSRGHQVIENSHIIVVFAPFEPWGWQVGYIIPVEVMYDIDETCEPVLAGPGQVHQIIMNLSTNAYHAMKETGGVLLISLKQIVIDDSQSLDQLILKPGCYVKLVVGDTGAGITD